MIGKCHLHELHNKLSFIKSQYGIYCSPTYHPFYIIPFENDRLIGRYCVNGNNKIS